MGSVFSIPIWAEMPRVLGISCTPATINLGYWLWGCAWTHMRITSLDFFRCTAWFMAVVRAWIWLLENFTHTNACTTPTRLATIAPRGPRRVRAVGAAKFFVAMACFVECRTFVMPDV